MSGWRILLLGAFGFLAMLGIATAIGPPGTSAPCVADAPTAERESAGPGDLLDLESELVADGFEDPVGMFTIPESDRVFVVEKPGRIMVVDEGETLDTPLLDMTPLVWAGSNEQGLLSAVPDPDFAENCHLFLFYVDFLGDSQLVRVTVGGTDQQRVDLRTMAAVLQVPQDQRWHQSGSMEFGPDGYLWVTIGDGGFIGDPRGHGQNPRTLEGTVVRLDVSTLPYSIPDSNPFVGGDEGRGEVWAYGLRNPWRIAIDAEEGLVYIPDTGLTEREEINVVPLNSGGLNFGWSIAEGNSCFEALECDTSGLTAPTIDWAHDGTACAVIGGEVYRGEAIPEMYGHYFYADFCFGWIRSFRVDGGNPHNPKEWESLQRNVITSFSTDRFGELYYTTFQGELWRIVPKRAQ